MTVKGKNSFPAGITCLWTKNDSASASAGFVNSASIIRIMRGRQMPKSFNLLNDWFGIETDVVAQYHRASERKMSFVRPSFKRTISEVEKKYKVKLTGFSYIREHDSISHTTKVADRNRMVPTWQILRLFLQI